MAENGRRDENVEGNIEGAVDEVKGTFKKVVGTVTGSDDLVAQGEAQAEKGKAESKGSGSMVSGERSGREW